MNLVLLVLVEIIFLLIVHIIILVVDFIVELHLVLRVDIFLLGQHLIIRLPFTLALGLPALTLIGLRLAILLPALNAKLGDLQGLAAGDVALQLGVVLFFEVEADVDGDSGGHQWL